MGSPQQRVLATMVTTTSFGTWPPGDLRGYVEDGVILPGDPKLLDRSRRLMKTDPVYFTAREQERCLPRSCAPPMSFNTP